MARITPIRQQKTKAHTRGVRREKLKIALVLGGGGLKGFSHIGVIRALKELDIDPTAIAGTSIGALIGAAHAKGMDV